jgi:LysM repeat protein
MPDAVTATYPAAAQRLAALGAGDAESVLSAAQAGDTQTARNVRVTYLGLGEFRMQTRQRRPPSRTPEIHHTDRTRPGQPVPAQVPRAAGRRTGRKAAVTAATAVVPVATLAGVALIAGMPQAHADAKPPAAHPRSVTRVHAMASAGGYSRYTVRPGDTLTAIAQRIWHQHFAAWIQLYMANKGEIHDPNLIYPGQVLKVPDTPGHVTAGQERAALTAARQSQPAGNENGGPGDDGSPRAPAHTTAQAPATLSGTLGCSGLEQLWDQAGGNPADATLAAGIAMAESSGQQDASSPAGDVGYWQINEPIWGSALATSDPMGNAKAAIQISNDGTNWGPWVTYQTGAYQGQC